MVLSEVLSSTRSLLKAGFLLLDPLLMQTKSKQSYPRGSLCDFSANYHIVLLERKPTEISQSTERLRKGFVSSK